MSGDDSRMPMAVESRDELPEDQRHNYDRIVDPRGSLGRMFAILLNSPELGGRIGHLGAYLRFEGVLPGDERELAILTTARAFDSAYEWAAHEPIARAEGVREEAIDVVARRGSLDDLTDAEAVIVEYGRTLFADLGVPDRLFEAAKDRFGVQGLTELTVTFGYYAMLACVHNAFEITPPEGPPLP